MALAAEHLDEIISVRGLTKVYKSPTAGEDDLTAVNDLELSVKRGEIFGLLGPNGAGKTTTVGMLTTRVIPSSGSALVNGIDVVSDPARVKRHLGVVPQANTLDRSLTVWENLYFHGRYFGMNASQATRASDEALMQFRLTAKANAQVHHLSGGMAQRLMVARAILHRPAVLFLDEPTAGLDPQSRIALWEIVGRLNEEGQTILLTTHYMEEADRICNRVAIMDHGRILALDTPTRLKRAGVSQSGATGKVKVMLSRNLETVPAADGALAENNWPDETDAQRIRDDATDVAELLGFEFEGLQSDEVTLETVFINLTGRDLRE